MSAFEKEFLCEDIENLLINHEEMSLYLKKLKENCADFTAKLEHKIKDSILKNSECVNQVKKSSEAVVQLSNRKTELKKCLENVKLEQKVVEKRTINAIEETEKIKTETEKIKEEKEKISLELVDLEQEFEKTKLYMKKQWEALKAACKVYKDTLDIRIDLDIIDQVEHITIIFFWSENPTDQTYSALLIHQDDHYRVKKIEPELSTQHKYQLNQLVQFSKQSEVYNVTAFVCALRNLFLKTYFKK